MFGKFTLEAHVGFGAAVAAVLTPDPSLSGTEYPVCMDLSL